MIHIKEITAKTKVPLPEYENNPLGLSDRFPIGYLAGSSTQEAILHDPCMVYRYHMSGKIILKGDSISLLCKLVDSSGKKIVALGKKGF